MRLHLSLSILLLQEIYNVNARNSLRSLDNDTLVRRTLGKTTRKAVEQLLSVESHRLEDVTLDESDGMITTIALEEEEADLRDVIDEMIDSTVDR